VAVHSLVHLRMGIPSLGLQCNDVGVVVNGVVAPGGEEDRVLTVIQEPTRKQKDFGLIGFREMPHASYLVFPRSLPQDGDSRVIGINYDLVAEPRVAHPIRPEDLKARPAPPPLRSVEKTFWVRVRRTATLETQVVVQAPNWKSAQQRAVESLKNQPFEVDKAVIQEEVLQVE
ncbi:MAG TPA: hypothetical protein VNZ22_11715, partial [Bacillota bacterium]|nr:hypothetical protein [Bacillota bacterium]